jgi:hypothetical protein
MQCDSAASFCCLKNSQNVLNLGIEVVDIYKEEVPLLRCSYALLNSKRKYTIIVKHNPMDTNDLRIFICIYYGFGNKTRQREYPHG